MIGQGRARLAALGRELGQSGGGYLLGATLVQSIGQGAAMACNAVFFVQIVGLSPGEVGFTHSVAALVSMAFAAIIGPLVDQRGARTMAIWLAMGTACAVAAYSLVFDLIGFVLVQLLVASMRMGKQIGENALIGQLMSGRARFRAYQRSVFNVGLSLGTLAAAVPLALNTRQAYLVLIFCNAAVIVLGALLLRAIPGSAIPVVQRTRRDWQALRDVRYVSLGLLTGLMEIRDSILTIALPLWIAVGVDAPPPLVAFLLFVNTMLVIALQVWASRSAESVPAAARVMRRGGVALGTACVVAGAAHYLSAPWPSVVLIVAVICLTFGEMWTAAGGWTLSYELADPRAHGEYQGVFEMTSGIGLLVGPILATTVALSYGIWGWSLIGAGFVLVGIVAQRVVAHPRGESEAPHRVPAEAR